MDLPQDALDRFAKHFTRGDENSCWEWTGGRAPYGYGALWFNGRTHGAHRIAWIIAHGEHIPPLMVSCHRCDTPPCVNPAHLFLGTKGDNNRDCYQKGRGANLEELRKRPRNMPRGENHWRAVLTEDSVREIRRAVSAGERRVNVADRFNVSKSTISLVMTRQRWRHVAV